MRKKQIVYRGLIKSCNYKCEYCPFSKHVSRNDLAKDELALKRFVDFVKHRSELNTDTNNASDVIGQEIISDQSLEALVNYKSDKMIGAVQIVPYGEALIHEYYWKAMAELTCLPDMDVVGVQTNLSFPVKRMLEVFDKAGGDRSSLSLWCTYHPSQTSEESFESQCELLQQESVGFCVGSVGVPENLALLKSLREKLPKEIYLWINSMDGLKRQYSVDEIEAFTEIDSLFPYLLTHKAAKPDMCRGCKGDTMFVDYKGDATPCNISKKKLGNIYEPDFFETAANIESCGQRECSCFLAYCNRMDYPELTCYGMYPTFRMARLPQAMFFDVDGTLIKGEKPAIVSFNNAVSYLGDDMLAKIAYWSRYSKIYLATSLPPAHALKKCSQIRQYLSGGVFDNGGMIYMFDKENINVDTTIVYGIKDDAVKVIRELAESYPVKSREYKHRGSLYKITMTGAGTARLYEKLKQTEDIFVIMEGEYLEITASGTGKLNGVMKICELCGYDKTQIMVAGDSENDREMLGF